MTRYSRAFILHANYVQAVSQGRVDAAVSGRTRVFYDNRLSSQGENVVLHSRLHHNELMTVKENCKNAFQDLGREKYIQN